ncbi:hypothetical protein T492DRAFT_841496 [Pavlovales sp. CCMP2436]|nr:hypothetical protein T492DRAFT_841496 [Pavlovales sp. CCMP2436]
MARARRSDQVRCRTKSRSCPPSFSGDNAWTRFKQKRRSTSAHERSTRALAHDLVHRARPPSSPTELIAEFITEPTLPMCGCSACSLVRHGTVRPRRRRRSNQLTQGAEPAAQDAAAPER